CINCGRCVRTCAEIQGPAVLGYVYRGYTAVVVPEYDESLTQTTCESCGKCIAVCPVGALVEKNVNYKLNPLLRDSTPQNCGLCGVGCHLVCETQSSLPVLMGTDEENPGFNDRNLCFDGRFGWQILFGEERLKEPMRREGTSWKAIGWDEVLNLVAAAAGAAKKKRFHISPNISLEEMLIFRRAAQNAGATLHSDPRHKVFSSKYLQMTPNPKPFALLDWFDEYVVIGEVSHTLRTMLRLKQRAGKKLSSVSFGASKPLRFADERHSSLDTLKLGSEQLFIYNLNRISERAIATVLNTAHGIDPSLSNVLETSDYVNYNGLQLIGANFGEPAKAGFVVAWGCDAKPSDKDTFKMEIRHFLDPNSRADLVLPAPSFLEIEGSALADDGGVALFKNPAKSLLMGELLRLFYSLGWISPATADINHWNEEVQRLLKTAPQAPAEKYDPRHMDINSLRDSVLSPDSLLWQHLEKFYQTRKSPVTF
ncbi:MAG: 4Fe-4S dicluster domain-containing protein, partial [Candidatus Cloacimonetes bacterium]|nr:4Fe-4S dicluster domain-containing protein [Candidatus Cloacimonadota bacterium]